MSKQDQTIAEETIAIDTDVFGFLEYPANDDFPLIPTPQPKPKPKPPIEKKSCADCILFEFIISCDGNTQSNECGCKLKCKCNDNDNDNEQSGTYADASSMAVELETTKPSSEIEPESEAELKTEPTKEPNDNWIWKYISNYE